MSIGRGNFRGRDGRASYRGNNYRGSRGRGGGRTSSYRGNNYRGSRGRRGQRTSRRSRGRGQRTSHGTRSRSYSGGQLSNHTFMLSVDLPGTEEIELSKLNPPAKLENLETRSTLGSGEPSVTNDKKHKQSHKKKPVAPPKKKLSKKQQRTLNWRKKQQAKARREKQQQEARRFSRESSFSVGAAIRHGWLPEELQHRPTLEQILHAQMINDSIQSDRYNPVLLGPLKVKRLNSTAKVFIPRSPEQIENDEKRDAELRKKRLEDFMRQEEKYQVQVARKQRRSKDEQEMKKQNQHKLQTKIKNTDLSLSTDTTKEQNNSPARSPRNKKKKGKSNRYRKGSKQKIKNRNEIVN